VNKKLIAILFTSLLLITNISMIGSSSSKSAMTNNSNGLIEHISSENLKPGDIMFETVYTFLIYVHTLMFIRYDAKNDSYIFIEAPANSVVRYESFSLEEISDPSHYKFGRVQSASEQQIQNAILFAERQLGKRFQIEFLWPKNCDPTDTSDIYADAWYCSELIWAAYYNCNHHPDEEIFGDGIDIDYNKGPFVKPRDIRRDLDVKVFFLKDLSFYDRIIIIFDLIIGMYNWFLDFLSSLD
jgi:uncharacterized protein YycO